MRVQAAQPVDRAGETRIHAPDSRSSSTFTSAGCVTANMHRGCDRVGAQHLAPRGEPGALVRVDRIPERRVDGRGRDERRAHAAALATRRAAPRATRARRTCSRRTRAFSGNATRSAIEPIVTMCPERRARIAGRNARTRRNGATRLTSIAERKSSTVGGLDRGEREEPGVVDEHVGCAAELVVHARQRARRAQRLSVTSQTIGTARVADRARARAASDVGAAGQHRDAVAGRRRARATSRDRCRATRRTRRRSRRGVIGRRTRRSCSASPRARAA